MSSCIDLPRGARSPRRARALVLVAGVLVAFATTAHAEPVNVALRGKARQSSTVPAGEAWRAIDGSQNGNWSRGSVTHTVDGATEPWYELDLLQPVSIDEVRLHNRTDCCHARIDGIRIELSSVRCDATPRVVIASAPAVTGAPAVHVAPFAGSPTARYVCLRQATGGWISLAELEVMSSEPAGPGVLTGPNIGRGGESVDLADTAFARQSSTYSTAGASRAIDGNTSGTFSANSVTHTLTERNPWLEIGLGLESAIDAVIIYNRTDCCSDRLVGAKVELSLDRCDAPSPTIVATSAPLTSSTFQQVEFNDQRARYVCIRQTREIALSVAEVKVMGTPPAHLARNLARGRLAAMSSSAGGAASYITDGNTDGNIDHGTLALTSNTTGQWMMIDLMASPSPAIGSVVIHNRIHYGADRLNGTRLQIADTPCSASATVGTLVPVAVVDSSPTVTVMMPPGTRGRFVCLRNTRAEYLTVAEIQVFPPLAPGQAYPATSRQSTSTPGRGSQLAIDGNPLGVWAGGSVTRTAVDTAVKANDTGPWLEVDLIDVRRIGSVVVRNRTDDLLSQLNRAHVELSLDRCDVPTRRVVRDERLPIDDMQFTVSFPPALKSGAVAARVQLDFVEAPAARFVCIRHDRRAILSLAEVEVYAGAPAANLAKGAPTRQSSTLYEGEAVRATDGWIDGAYSFGSVTRTADGDPAPWLEVDLGTAQPLRELAVWNRTDRTPERLVGARVELSDDPCDRSDRHVTWSATLPSDPFLWRPTRRTGFVFPTPRTARYVCIRHVAAGKILSVAEVQAFGLGDDEDPAPEPPPVVASVAAARAADLGAVEVAAPQATFATTGDTTSLSVRIAGGVAIPCELEETGARAYQMTCSDGPAIAMTGSLASATSYDLTSAGEYGFADLAGRGLFPGQLAAGLDAMASMIGVRKVRLGLDNRRGFFITGDLALATLPGSDPISKALRTAAGFLGNYAPGFDDTPAFQLVPSLSGAGAKLLLRLEVINTCAGDRDISAIGAGFKLNKGALELSLGVNGPELEISAGFAADALIRPTRHDPWLRFSPGIELGQSTTATSVTLKGQLSGACPATCAATCSCEPSDCNAPWHPIGNPLFSLSNGYLEVGASAVAEAVPMPVVNVAFDDARFGTSLHGSFAMGFDYRAQQFGFQFSADRMPLLGALGVLIPTAGLPLPSWLEVKNPRISFATRGFRIFNATIPAGFRVAGGLDLAPVGLRGQINAIVPPSAMDLSSLTAGNLVVGAPQGLFELSIDTSELLRKVLSVGPFDAIARPIVERTLWIKGFAVKLGIGGFAAQAGASVQFQMFGKSFDLGFDVAVAFDPKAIATKVGDEVLALILDPGRAIKAAFDGAVAGAKRAAEEVAAAFATGAAVVINGVVTATSKVIAVSGTVADAFEDFGDTIVTYGDPSNW